MIAGSPAIVLALRTHEFSSWLRHRGLSYSAGELSRLAAHGVLLPVAVLVEDPLGSRRYPPAGRVARGRLYGDRGRAVLAPELRRKAPQLRLESDGMLWHPFQLWNVERLNRILSRPTHVTPTTSLMPPRDYARFVRRILERDLLHEDVAAFVASDELAQFEGVLSLLLAAEPLVPQATRGLVTFRFTNIEPSWSDYEAWASGIVHDALMDDVGLSVEELKSWHHKLATSAVLLDPLERWRVLVRYAPRSQRERFKGDALLAEDLYYAAEVLREYLQVFHGVDDLPEEDSILFGPQVPAVKERLYGEPTTTTANRSVFRNVVRHFGLDPQPRFRWLIEGPTEAAFIRRWAELPGTNLLDRGVELITLRSVGELDGDRVRAILEISRDEEVFVSATVDGDGVSERVRKLQRLASDGLLPAGWTLFAPDFEEANFTLDQLARAATALAQESPETSDVVIRAGEIADARREGKPVWDAIDRVARARLAYLNKGERWGQLLANVLWEDASDDVPIVRAFRSALRADGSNYRFTVLDTDVGPDGSLVRREGA